MPFDPNSPVPSDASLRALIAIYEQAQRKLRRLIRDAVANQATYTEAFRRRQLAEITRLSANLQKQGPALAAAVTTQAYRVGIHATDASLGGSALETGRVHERALQVLADALAGNLKVAGRTVGRQARDSYRRAGLKGTAEAIATGDTRRAASAAIERELLHDGITGFIDKAGRRWTLANYTRMAALTVSRQAVSTATRIRMGEHGEDLVTISDHGTDCASGTCQEFEGNTYSLTGDTPGYDVLEEEPPFHPGCWHVMTPAAGNLDAFVATLRATPPATGPSAS